VTNPSGSVGGDPIRELRQKLRQFAADRDWEQFHTPKNLAIAISVEAAELLEHFQWLTSEQSEKLSESDIAKVRLELADVLLYLLSLSDRLGVDLVAAALDKLAINAKKYPVELAKGNAKKYTDL
jgi:NTP pyrophosphatase (non-canonical NTP hydrolase)